MAEKFQDFLVFWHPHPFYQSEEINPAPFCYALDDTVSSQFYCTLLWGVLAVKLATSPCHPEVPGSCNFGTILDRIHREVGGRS